MVRSCILWMVFGVIIVLEGEIAFLDWLTEPGIPISQLYYIPTVLAAGFFAFLGAFLVVALSAELFYVTEVLLPGANYEQADLLRISSFLLLGTLVALLIMDRQRLRTLARTDHLTGLANYQHFTDMLSTELARSGRFGHSFALLMLDIDNFKRVNDSHGHRIGNVVLKEISALLCSNVRRIDVAARYGGEEFCVILPETGKEEAIQVAERLRKLVDAHEFASGQSSESVHVTVCVGVATYPKDGKDWEALLSAADQAMYEAKKAGRNQVGLIH